jgi:glucokinase
MHVSQRTALIGDIGGTHARLALCDVDELSVEHFAVFTTDMFASLPDAVSHYLESVPARPDIAGFSVAGPITGDTITMTNCPWVFTRQDVQAACGASRIHFLNDFEALAQCLPYLNPHDFRQIGGGKPVEDAPKIVLGPGSGFGCAGLIRHAGHWVPVAGEGGHIGFAACNERELAVLARVADASGYAPAQAVLSSRGLAAVHAALAEIDGVKGEGIASIDIIKHAFATENPDERALQTLEFFAAILARVAGDMALVYGARGGVYISGGITSKILSVLQEPGFRATFENKGRMAAYLKDIPLYAMLAYDAGLRGTALAVSNRFPMEPAV